MAGGGGRREDVSSSLSSLFFFSLFLFFFFPQSSPEQSTHSTSSNPPPSVRASERRAATGAAAPPLARSGRLRADGARGRTSPQPRGGLAAGGSWSLCLCVTPPRVPPLPSRHGNYPPWRANSLRRVIVPATDKGRLAARPPDPCHPLPSGAACAAAGAAPLPPSSKRAINHREVTGPGWRQGKGTPCASPEPSPVLGSWSRARIHGPGENPGNKINAGEKRGEPYSLCWGGKAMQSLAPARIFPSPWGRGGQGARPRCPAPFGARRVAPCTLPG